MGILDIFKRNNGMRPDVLLRGKWVLVRADSGIDIGDGVEMEFHPDARLTYAIRQGDKLQIVKMTYRLEGNLIISDQPSAPNEERTSFIFENNLLVLDSDGSRSWFKRINEK